MDTFHYTKAQYENYLCPFQFKYADDWWVAFHGTSSIFEDKIDSSGLAWNNSVYSHDDIESLLKVFDQLYWCGTDGEGYGVLASFSQGKKPGQVRLLSMSRHLALRPLHGGQAGGSAIGIPGGIQTGLVRLLN